MRNSKRILAVLTGSAFIALAGAAQADVKVRAEINKNKDVEVFEFIDITKVVDLVVFEYIAVDSVAEQLVIKNQRNQFNFVEDENPVSTAEINASATSASGVTLINQSPGFINNQGNEVSVTAAASPGNPTFLPQPAPGEGVTFANFKETAPLQGFVEGTSGVFAHAEVSVEQINGFDPDEDNFDGEFGNEYVNVFPGFLTNTITGSFDGGSGVAGVNQAAGSLNNQNNALAVAIGTNAVYALGEADLGQFNTRNSVDVLDQIRTDTIGGCVGEGCTPAGSFNGFTGVVMVNQSSGSLNNQANVIDIAVDAAAVLPDLGNIGGTPIQ